MGKNQTPFEDQALVSTSYLLPSSTDNVQSSCQRWRMDYGGISSPWTYLPADCKYSLEQAVDPPSTAETVAAYTYDGKSEKSGGEVPTDCKSCPSFRTAITES